MKELITIVTEIVSETFGSLGYDKESGRVSVSNRPDLCEYQCNGAMALAKSLHKNPMEIAEAVAAKLSENDFFEKAEAIKPGFINLDIAPSALLSYAKDMAADESHLSLIQDETGKKFFLDYGGPNVAKPLHVGHLRSAIIGESVKRILLALGYDVTCDIHLGDWGQQMGLIITELGKRGIKPPLDLATLEEVYPYASAKAKEDEDYKKEAMSATHKLQQGDEEYNNILKEILKVSIADLKKNYERMNVDFDLWRGESDAAPYINDMVEDIKQKGFAYESEGALVVDVAEESDTKEVPPCMILKSDGAALYNTTDLATLVWRMKDYNPDELVYIVDKRQGLYFEQVFRCSKKVGIVPQEKQLTFLGFGTMNGPDKKPFKTREGGVMRLSVLLDDVKEKCLEKIEENETIAKEDKEKVAAQIALSAIKYGDLSNAPGKDYVFDLNRFVSFEGNTGPYILYTIVRIKSILRKYTEEAGEVKLLNCDLIIPKNKVAKDLYLSLCRFNSAVAGAGAELAPNRLCAYVYELSNAFNSFYHETKILSCPDENEKKGFIALINLTKKVLEKSIDLLGFSAPEAM